jgi:hypothetical protein
LKVELEGIDENKRKERLKLRLLSKPGEIESLEKLLNPSESFEYLFEVLNLCRTLELLNPSHSFRALKFL